MCKRGIGPNMQHFASDMAISRHLRKIDGRGTTFHIEAEGKRFYKNGADFFPDRTAEFRLFCLTHARLLSLPSHCSTS